MKLNLKKIGTTFVLALSIAGCSKLKVANENQGVGLSSDVLKYSLEDSETFSGENAKIGGWFIATGLIDDNFDPAYGFDRFQEPHGAARRFCWLKGFDEVDTSKVQSTSISTPENPRAGVPNNVALNFYRKSSRTEPLYALMGQKTPSGWGAFDVLTSVTCVGKFAKAPDLQIGLFDGRNGRIDLTRNNWLNVGMIVSGYQEAVRLYDRDPFLSTGEINAEGTRVWGAARSFCVNKGYDDALGNTQRPVYDFELECKEYDKDWVCEYDRYGDRYCYWKTDYNTCIRREAKESSLAFVKNSTEPRLRRSQIRYSTPGNHIFHSITCYKKTENRIQASQLQIMNAASFINGSIAQEGAVTIKGKNLSRRAGSTSASTSPLPETLGGVIVRIGGKNAPLSYVSPDQINLIVPAGLDAGRSYPLEIESEGLIIGFTQVTLNSAAPGIFTADGSGTGFANGHFYQDGATSVTGLSQDGQPAEVPASTEELKTYVTLFGTGMRKANKSEFSVSIAGVKAEVESVFGNAGIQGLDGLTIILPAELTERGDLDVSIEVRGVKAAPVKLKIK